MKCSFLQISILFLGIACCGVSRAQRCNMSGVPALSALELDFGNNLPWLFDPWYIQDIIVKHTEDLEEEAQRECYVQSSRYIGEMFYIFESWKNVATGESASVGYMAATDAWHENWALWFAGSIQKLYYSFQWVHTDYINYAIQYYCPEEDADERHLPESMLILTRNPTPDPVTLRLLEEIAAGYGFPKENAVRINNTGCPPPEIRKRLNE